mmetsp:Transcript_4230/g.10306  ORF Transcript_4230/g.10306 Transcript_4230/m.10306 type:complete len:393 (-) Transcript_4230:294-1472(-)
MKFWLGRARWRWPLALFLQLQFVLLARGFSLRRAASTHRASANLGTKVENNKQHAKAKTGAIARARPGGGSANLALSRPLEPGYYCKTQSYVGHFGSCGAINPTAALIRDADAKVSEEACERYCLDKGCDTYALDLRAYYSDGSVKDASQECCSLIFGCVLGRTMDPAQWQSQEKDYAYYAQLGRRLAPSEMSATMSSIPGSRYSVLNATAYQNSLALMASHPLTMDIIPEVDPLGISTSCAQTDKTDKEPARWSAKMQNGPVMMRALTLFNQREAIGEVQLDGARLQVLNGNKLVWSKTNIGRISPKGTRLVLEPAQPVTEILLTAQEAGRTLTFCGLQVDAVDAKRVASDLEVQLSLFDRKIVGKPNQVREKLSTVAQRVRSFFGGAGMR